MSAKELLKNGITLKENAQDRNLRRLLNAYLIQPYLLDIFDNIQGGRPLDWGVREVEGISRAQFIAMADLLEDAGATVKCEDTASGYRALVPWIKVDIGGLTPKSLAKASASAATFITELMSDSESKETARSAILKVTGRIKDQLAFSNELTELMTKYLNKDEVFGEGTCTLRMALVMKLTTND